MVLIGVVGHYCYGFRSWEVMPTIGNYADPYKTGSRFVFSKISQEFIPENIQHALRGKGIDRRDVFFILYDLSALKSPYNMVMHPALQAWTGKRIINKSIDMSFFDTVGIVPDGRNSVSFGGLKKINVNVHPTKERGVLAWSPNNARFMKGREGIGAGWFVALSPDQRYASISYVVLIYDKNLKDLIEGNRRSRDVDIDNYFEAMERTYEMLGDADQRILGIALENMKRFFIAGYEPVIPEPIRRRPIPEPEPVEKLPIVFEEEEDSLIAGLEDLIERLLDLLNILRRGSRL